MSQSRLARLLELNRQVLAQAVDLRLTPGQRGALDGSFVAGNASRRAIAMRRSSALRSLVRSMSDMN